MTKRDLVVRISSETGLIQQDVLAVVQKTLDYIQKPFPKEKRLNCVILVFSKSKFARLVWGVIPISLKMM